MQLSGVGVLQRLGSGLVVLLLVGCSTLPVGTRPASAQQLQTEDRGQLLFEILVSELAIRRGELAVAAEGYLRATQRTDDPRVAERATQLAVYYQQWDAAESTAKRWLSLDPESLSAHETLGQIYLRQSDVEGAVSAFAEWVDASDEVGTTFLSINQVLQRDPDRELAFTVATELSKKYPEQPLAHVGRAQLALAVSERGDALEAANDALTLDSTLVEALLVKAQVQISQGQSPDALKTLQAAVTEQPDSLPLHLGYAQLLVESELYDRAVPVIERAGELSEGDATTWLRLGLLSLTARRDELATKYLSGVLKDDPYNERAHFYLGRIADRRRDFDAAIGHYDAVPQGEFFLSSQIRAAELTAESGRLNDAIERIRSLSPLAADSALKVQLVAAESRILQEAGRGQEAVDVLTAGLEKHPNDSDLLYARALISESLGNDDQFETDLTTLIEAEPNNAHALNALGYHLAVNNIRLDEAEELLLAANALEPDDAAIMDSLGWLRFRQGQLEEAKRLLQIAYVLYPDAEIAAHLGEVLWTMGDEAGARDVWEKALADSPDHKALNDVLNRFVEK